MKLFEVRTTEHNGEQEYSNSHLLAARDIGQARSLAREFFKTWYEDGKARHADQDDSDKFEFLDGCIILEIDSIVEVDLEEWKQRQVELHSIGKLPMVKRQCKGCKALIEACAYILNCLNVGGEQSRQFAGEIACLNRVLKENRK